jgi:NAD(P)-dependent dehydrogenase (short-subunit alcohol dehydrogenase family)
VSASDSEGRFAGRAAYVLGAGTARPATGSDAAGGTGGSDAAGGTGGSGAAGGTGGSGAAGGTGGSDELGGTSAGSGPEPIGNGRAIAIRLANEGARVALVDRDLDSARQTLELCGGGGCAIAADATDVEQCLAAVAEARQRLGALDVVVCSVGIDFPERPSLEQLTVEQWQLINDVNVRSHWLTAKAALPDMVDRGGGVFVFVGSTGGLTGSGAYGITKAALIGLTRGIATSYGRHKVRANLVAPGVVDTPMLQHLYGGDDGRVRERMLPLGRAGTPQEVAAAVAYLASDDAGYVNGHVLTVDGGLTTRSFLALNEQQLHGLGFALAEQK